MPFDEYRLDGFFVFFVGEHFFIENIAELVYHGVPLGLDIGFRDVEQYALRDMEQSVARVYLDFKAVLAHLRLHLLKYLRALRDVIGNLGGCPGEIQYEVASSPAIKSLMLRLKVSPFDALIL